MSVLADRNAAPQTGAYPPATWRRPQTQPPETADKAPLGLPTNFPQRTHTYTATQFTVLVALALLMYPLPVRPSSAPSVISFILACLSLSVSAHSLSPAPPSPVCLPKICVCPPPPFPPCLFLFSGSNCSASLFHCYPGLCNRIFPVLVDD